MLKNRIFFIICISVFYSCKPQNKKINGLSFVASSEKISEFHRIPLRKVSANYVSLMPFAFIKDLQSPELRFNEARQWFGETKAGVKQYANELKKEQVKLMIKPQIWVWKGNFTGNIKMKHEEDWMIFEQKYSNFIIAYAEVAEELNADILCIGTELEQFVMQRPEYWVQLIKNIRKVYSGKLTYAANWDEFKRVPFWNELDFIGIDAYFPLTDEKSPTEKEFEEGWQPHKKVIEKFSNQYSKPILFTEFGYRSVNYTGREPWDSKAIKGEVNLEAQKNATQAIYNEFWKEEWFAGGFLWKWFHNHEEAGGVNDNRFTPQNKPTEKLIKQLYEN